ncbi:MAG: DUF3782 domain-containing protein [Kamptonema sp. SIO4C4]|nr:DUF3782 domain-containing protein [Kamptonema sp. SIO4C4]
MTEEEIKELIRQELPNALQDRDVRDFVLRTVEQFYAGRQETESRFDQILNELRRDREEQRRKWEEQNRKWEENQQQLTHIEQRIDHNLEEIRRDREEQNRKWEEQNRKWEEQQQHNHRILEEIRQLNRKHDSTIGALGARWGVYSESSFRNALKGILEESFGVQVVSITEYDDAGEVFGRPEQIELDLIIQNGVLILCEIKSSVSKADIYSFEKKVRFYTNRHQRTVNRKIIISPMVHPRAEGVADPLGIEVYSYAEDVPTTPYPG